MNLKKVEIVEEEKPEEEIEETDKDKWAIERKTANQANKKRLIGSTII